MIEPIAPVDDLACGLADEVFADARRCLSSAMIFAMAVRSDQAAALMSAFSEQVGVTTELYEAGLIPRSAWTDGEHGVTKALIWMERNIASMLVEPDVHPMVRHWSLLNDERHRIRHLLPALN